eukprot:TRINITY_DN2327_c0_g1_i1.p1 TRINITY_DN2327_c0_g1~~TRINITY_DN2327_c0_g1_i1.p1  ORF type:complete len:147 (-),score=32.69 TRINITY_DN2327_c0_g1_i1:19-459(-)
MSKATATEVVYRLLSEEGRAIPRASAGRVVQSLFDHMADMLAATGRFSYSGFGALSVRHVAARRSVGNLPELRTNPKAELVMTELPATNRTVFRPSRVLKEEMKNWTPYQHRGTGATRQQSIVNSQGRNQRAVKNNVRDAKAARGQ